MRICTVLAVLYKSEEGEGGLGQVALENENRIAGNMKPKTITYQFHALLGPIKEWSDSFAARSYKKP